ncbi:hypothetical protein L1987_26059 [Smallanthus sonchifolius]|uniref:Uncharacterized protein n=1 Tax=Smallanthus sonchifolius TaxID=185202 RepID=A0ACB9IAU6_9ASTR|nr:hypothetical protein L1987_26059 [Smallanthus sonchifolius]
MKVVRLPPLKTGAAPKFSQITQLVIGKHQSQMSPKDRTIGVWKNVPQFVSSSEYELQSKYKLAKSNSDYSRLRQIAKVNETWDDQDYRH